ncbi:MAG TPA: DAK2 domain-containing protein [Bacteroidales bacterium]|jgi:dihydroxyacetone kinase-like predicted kinase|nr:DAK2 domain-containing protein [Bacteroidales bacterium]OQC58080.1 MAG: DAK2 domain protein [Bacteroidetes bacterium ADurb.Bin013]HPA43696.1 DAK2 domain-containing protein [Bacteroidales bacterium]HQB56769.1 DAK2 domain-containing protein [Bacteroidales bacterium]HQM98549.1 DAK2 domain-containing protein [Bacteroidales bacterium]
MRREISEIKQLFDNISEYFWRHKEYVNRLNVFPVPDGDTGLNIALTIQGALSNIPGNLPDTILAGEYLKLISDNMLLNSRGCSGVILSLFFEGITEVLENNDFSRENILRAIEKGCITAYKGTDNPREGTMLTLMSELKKKYSEIMTTKENPLEIIIDCIPHLREVLDKTPDMLPILKQSGVVDSGGAGFLIILEGLEREFNSRKIPETLPLFAALRINSVVKNLLVKRFSHKKRSDTGTLVQNLGAGNITNARLHKIIHNVQQYLKNRTHSHNNRYRAREALIKDTKEFESSWNPDIRYRYCTELTVSSDKDIDSQALKEQIINYGDSLIISGRGNTFKIHIHTNKPDSVIKDISLFGNIISRKVDDMKKQHRNFISFDSIEYENEQSVFCIVSGEGFKKILQNLGADYVYDYGKRKPSVKKLVDLLNSLKSKNVIAAPDDRDILMTLKYAASLCKANVFIVESKDAISLISLLMGKTNKINNTNFLSRDRINNIKHFMISKAAKESSIDDIPIKKGDFFVICDNKIILTGRELKDVATKAINKLLNDESIITVYNGLHVKGNKLAAGLKNKFPGLEFEEYYGGQTQYLYYLTLE